MKRLTVTILGLLTLALGGCFESSDGDALPALLLDGSSSNPEAEANEVDETAPYVLSSNPFNNATQVPLNVGLGIQFSEPIDATSIEVITNGSSCDGTIALSRDNFQSCIPFEDPNPGGKPSLKTLVLRPAADLLSATAYKLRISGELRDLSGNKLGVTLFNGFKTQNIADDSFVLQCPDSISRREYLKAGAQFKIECTVSPVSTSRIIREVLIVPGYIKREGGFVNTYYEGIADKLFTFYNDSVAQKTVSLSGNKFSPSFEAASTMQQYGYLGLGVHVHYKDGDNVSTTINILLDDDVPAVTGYYYRMTALLFVTDFEPSATELPKAQWMAWISVKNPDGSELVSEKKSLSMGWISLERDLIVRPSTGPREKVYLLVDSTGDGVEDYKWPVIDYEIDKNGRWALLNAMGLRENNQNIPEPITVVNVQ